MDNKEMAAFIATFIVAHGAATLTVLWKGITLGVKKLIEWERLQHRLNDIEKLRQSDLDTQRAINEKLQKDIDAAFAKIRT